MTETKITPAEAEVTPAGWLHFSWPEACKNEPITALHRDLLKKIEEDVLTIDPTVDPDSDIFRIAVLVIAGGMLVGPFLDRLIVLTGFPRAMVNDVCLNMRFFGIWKEFAVDAEWLDEEGYRAGALLCHVLVVMGILTAKWDNEKGAWACQAVAVN